MIYLPQRPHSRIRLRSRHTLAHHCVRNSNLRHDAQASGLQTSRGFANIKNGLVTCAHVHDHASDPLRCSRPRYCSSFLFASLPIPIASKNDQPIAIITLQSPLPGISSTPIRIPGDTCRNRNWNQTQDCACSLSWCPAAGDLHHWWSSE